LSIKYRDEFFRSLTSVYRDLLQALFTKPQERKQHTTTETAFTCHECLEESQQFSQNKTVQWLVPVTTSVATRAVSNDFVWRLPGAHPAGLWLPLSQRCLCVTLQRCLLGPATLFRDFLEMRNFRREFPMVPKVVRNGPGHTSTKKSWSHD